MLPFSIKICTVEIFTRATPGSPLVRIYELESSKLFGSFKRFYCPNGLEKSCVISDHTWKNGENMSRSPAQTERANSSFLSI